MVNELYELADLYLGKDNVKVVIEAGALDCKDSLVLTTDFPNAHVYSFECNPDSIKVCKNNIEGNDRVTLTEKGLGDKDGDSLFFPIDTKKTVTTHEDGNPGASSFFVANKEYPFETYAQNQVQVPVTTLQTFCKEKGIEEIDVLRLDTQGSELSILKGLGHLIEKVKVIQIEVLFKPQYLHAPLFDEVIDFLESKNFRFVRYVTKFEWSGDALLIRNDL